MVSASWRVSSCRRNSIISFQKHGASIDIQPRVVWSRHGFLHTRLETHHFQHYGLLAIAILFPENPIWSIEVSITASFAYMQIVFKLSYSSELFDLVVLPCWTAPARNYRHPQSLTLLPWHCTAKRFQMGQCSTCDTKCRQRTSTNLYRFLLLHRLGTPNLPSKKKQF